MTRKKAAMIGAVCGLPVGIVMLFIACNLPEGSHLANMLFYPSELLGRGLATLWFSLGLGPHGDAGFGVMIASGMLAFLIQWVVIGAIVGLFFPQRHSE